MVDIGIPGYTDAQLLGQGSFGVVYKCQQVALNRTVAIKVFRASEGSLPFDLFARECAAIGQLDWCPQIVTVFSTGQTELGDPYIAMEFAPGGSLSSHLAQHGLMDESAVRRVGIHMATALATAHEAGILHRDVKPANVLISRTGDPVLADFGIARLAGGTATATGLVSGTIAYSAPEVLEGHAATPQSDIYSLGAMLYACLCGHAPFVQGRGEAMAAVIARTLVGPPADLTALPVSSAFAAILAKCLQREPSRRFVSARDLSTALEGLINAQAEPGRTVPRASLREWPSEFYLVAPRAGAHVPTGLRWPTATDYVAAVQAKAAPIDADGFREARIVRDSLGMPASASGQNAVVFELSHRTGPIALRCFTRQPIEAQTRYRELSGFLANHDLPAVTPSIWLDEALSTPEGRWPAVIMPWVPGVPLNVGVEDMLDRPGALRNLAESFISTVADLYRTGAAHGDLQSGNILIDNEGVIRLVDMDGFFAPGMSAAPVELGHPHFQHPERTRSHWGEDADGFSVLVIYLSLIALADNAELWRFNSDENLILGREDYLHPGETAVWRALDQSPVPQIRALTALLQSLCREPSPPTIRDVLSAIRPELAKSRSGRTESASSIASPTATFRQPAGRDTAGVAPTVLQRQSTHPAAAGGVDPETPWWKSAPAALPTEATVPDATVRRNAASTLVGVRVASPTDAATQREVPAPSQPAADSDAASPDLKPATNTRVLTVLGGSPVRAGLTAGIAAGALALALQQLVQGPLPMSARSPVFVTLIGSLLTAALGCVDAATMGAWPAVRRRGSFGLILGAAMCLVALALLRLSDVIGGIEPGEVPLMLLLFLWANIGVAIGLASGIVRGSWRALVAGALGGLLGGLVGAIAHWVSKPGTWAGPQYRTLIIEPTNPQTLLGIVVAAGAIGLAVGVASRVSRRCWLTVIEGPMRGREVVLERGRGTVGSGPSCDLKLRSREGIRDTHASLLLRDGAYQLLAHGPMTLDGEGLDVASERPILSGSVMGIGGSFIRFDDKQA